VSDASTAMTPVAVRDGTRSPMPVVAFVLTAAAFVWLFAEPARLLADDWWNNPEAGHGLLLAPVAGWLVWRSRGEIDRRPSPILGSLALVAAIVLRYLSALAAEVFTMRFAMVVAVVGLVLFWFGLRQVLRWWLPFTLLVLSIPLPEVIVNSLALPLQFRASEMGASLLRMRHVPVMLEGNVIHIPGNRLFVTEACSGLRSLTALVSLAVLVGGVWLRYPISRIAVLVAAIPIAVGINGIRVFLTGFLVYFVDPRLGAGFMHLTEGWLMFLVAFIMLGALAWMFGRIETAVRPIPADKSEAAQHA
jgi:exosortase